MSRNTAAKRTDSPEIPVWPLEIRKILKQAAVMLVVLVVAAWIVRDDLMAWIRWPLVQAFPSSGADTMLLRVIDLFIIHLKVCLYVAFGLLIPWIIWRLWSIVCRVFGITSIGFRFIAPASVSILFFCGVVFAYFVVMPMAFSFLVNYSMDSGGLIFTPAAGTVSDSLQISMREHISLTMGMLLAFGLGFQAPVVMVLLARMGIVSASVFAKQRGIAIVLLGALSALLTPPDPWTLLLMLGPMVLLYEIGIIASKIFASKKEEQNEASALDELE